MSTDEARALVVAALRRRTENGGRHLHHSECIHNLPPEQQIEMRGRTVEWWMKVVGSMPIQITPAEWESEPLDMHGAPR